ncbi:hypothetical protein K438DRAFT_1598209 [Mycena galopus ATCC 62051]|nr:hypothetical protein K438DRAFT_1598209 [Mycena galopus ATCC 62051]
MQEITPKEPGWDGWPTDDQVLKLSGKANGLFHYAATALRWIEEQIRKYKKAARKRVFDQFTQMGIGQLEDLYRLILTSFENIDDPAQDTDLRANQLRGFQHVVGTMLVLHKPLNIRQIIALLADIPEDDLDVTNFLKQFRSVLIPGTTTAFKEATPQMHKSFRDYITSDHAPTEFRILTGHAHFMTARSCMEVIVKAGRQSVTHWKYSIRYWHRHLRQAVENDMRCEDERMWDLFGQMVEKDVVDFWTQNSFDVFVDVATAGWGLLKQDTDEHRMEGIERILWKATVRGAPMLIGPSSLISGNSLIVSPSLLFTATNFFCLQPYKTIWDFGLLEAWERHQSLSSRMKAPLGQNCSCVIV